MSAANPRSRASTASSSSPRTRAPSAPPPGAQAAYAKLAAELHRYPDGGSTALRQAIGTRFGLDPARIVCGNGSDELIGHIIMAYGGEGTELVMSAHGFVMYDIAGRYAGCRVIKVPERNLTADVDAMLAAVGPRTRLVFLANPNNPTGTMLPASEVTRLRAGAARGRAAGAGCRLCGIRRPARTTTPAWRWSRPGPTPS